MREKHPTNTSIRWEKPLLSATAICEKGGDLIESHPPTHLLYLKYNPTTKRF